MPQTQEKVANGSKIGSKKENRFAFTQKRIDKLPLPADGRAYFYDEKTRGLCIAVSPLGKKVYCLYRKVNGRPERVTLGAVADLTIEQARGEASRLNGVIAAGQNPAEERRAIRAEMTIQELYDRFLRDYAKEKLRRSTWKNYESMFANHLHSLRFRKLGEIQRADVTALHARIGKTTGQHTANRVIELLSAMYNRAIKDFGYTGQNPALNIEAFKERARVRFLGYSDPKEPARFFAALGEEDQLWQDFFSLCVFTGARCSNVESAAWSEINWPRSEWRIPFDKAKEDENIFVRLTPEAMEILKRREANSASPWIFPTPRKSKSGHITESKSAWGRILKAAKIENLHVHDLRHTLGAFMAANGATLEQIGKQLGHAPGSSATRIYSHFPLTAISSLVDNATRAIAASADPKLLGTGADNGN